MTPGVMTPGGMHPGVMTPGGMHPGVMTPGMPGAVGMPRPPLLPHPAGADLFASPYRGYPPPAAAYDMMQVGLMTHTVADLTIVLFAYLRVIQKFIAANKEYSAQF